MNTGGANYFLKSGTSKFISALFFRGNSLRASASLFYHPVHCLKKLPLTQLAILFLVIVETAGCFYCREPGNLLSTIPPKNLEPSQESI